MRFKRVVSSTFSIFSIKLQQNPLLFALIEQKKQQNPEKSVIKREDTVMNETYLKNRNTYIIMYAHLCSYGSIMADKGLWA